MLFLLNKSGRSHILGGGVSFKLNINLEPSKLSMGAPRLSFRHKSFFGADVSLAIYLKSPNSYFGVDNFTFFFFSFFI